MFDGKRAVGVRCRQDGVARSARCRGEVILAAGAIGSPQIMMLSGVGPAAQLAQLGIPVVLDKPGVGANLHDHLQLRMIYKVSGITHAERDVCLAVGARLDGPRLRAVPARAADHGAVAARRLHALRSIAGPRRICSITSSRSRSTSSAIRCTRFRPSPPASPMCGRPAAARSRSNRRIPAAAPAIQPNYLATPEDRRVAAESIRITRKIVRAAGACKPYSPVEYLPGAQVRDDDEAALEKAAGDIGTTIFHPVGTARMGRADDARAVVDARLRVIGLERPARDRRLGDAVDHLRQHQLADHDDRREGRGDDAGGRASA